jgi:type VI secretion system protein ImpK
VEQSIGVFGENVLLWACLLRQVPTRPRADVMLQHANYLLDELKQSPEAQQLPVQSVDDGMFAIAALIDELAMGLPDLRPYWGQAMLQATRHMTNNAGVEVFQRLAERVRHGPRSVLATYAAVLGIGFQGSYGLPGADRYALSQLRRDLATQLGVDPDRDWKGGVLARTREQAVKTFDKLGEPWWRKVWFGRLLAGLLLGTGLVALLLMLYGLMS